jgi:hypothetical protein
MNNPLPIEPNGPEWEQKIREEAKRVREDESQPRPYEPELQRMMESWKVNRPQMWRHLRGKTLAYPLATVLQDRYQKEIDRLLEAGMPLPDAREQAMAGWLLEGPEDDPEEREATAE